MTTGELNKTEQTEPMYMTWGRIRTLAHELRNDRLISLVEKMNKDLRYAKVQEDYFDEDFNVKTDWNEIEGINMTHEQTQ